MPGLGALAFLDAALLAGLAVLALPTLIHLISKRRARRVRFAPLELLLRSQRRTARSIRLRQLLLLLLRTLILACAALALARPVLRGDEAPSATGAPLVVVVAVDVSGSMNAVLDGKSMFARAQRRALEVLGAQPTDVRIGAIACDDVPRDLAAPGFDRAAAVDAVSVLAAGFHHADLGACVARATSLARTVEGEGERRVVVVSDLAAHGFAHGREAAGEGRGIVVEWIAASDEDPPPNHAITSVQVERTSGRAGEALEVGFTAARFLGPAVDVTADLIVGDRRAARLSLPLEGGKSLKRTFHHALAAEERAAPGARLEVALGDDALAVDNAVQLPFDLPAPLSVLVVDGAPQPVPFRDEVFYLESALKDDRGGRGRIALEVVGADRLKPTHLAGVRVVVLANVARLEDPAVAAILEHVKAGGGLFLTMGDQIDVEWYNRALGEVLPAKLRGTKGQALLDDASVAEILSLTRFRAEHPVLRGLSAGAADELPGLGRVRTHTLMLLEPSAEATRDVLMRFSNEAPALLERVVSGGGDGRVMLLATTIDRDWSDLAIRPGFLPLMRQIVLHLGGALEQGGPRILHVGEPRVIRVPRGVEELEIEPPALRGRAQRERLRVEAGLSEVTFRGTDVPGLYRVYARAAGGEARERPDERFTVLLHPAESDLTRADGELLASAAPSGAVTRTSEQGDGDVPLWPWLLCAAVLLLLLEALLLRRGAQAA
jgi:hypothetical protein